VTRGNKVSVEADVGPDDSAINLVLPNERIRLDCVEAEAVAKALTEAVAYVRLGRCFKEWMIGSTIR